MHGFDQKFEIYKSLYFGRNRQGNALYDVLERKNALLDYKNKKLQMKVENLVFF